MGLLRQIGRRPPLACRGATIGGAVIPAAIRASPANHREILTGTRAPCLAANRTRTTLSSKGLLSVGRLGYDPAGQAITGYSMSGRTNLTIVLAAGEGTRMRSSLPKVLHPVAGQPLLRLVLADAPG